MSNRKWLVVSGLLALCIGLGATKVSAFTPVYSINNNFSMLDSTGAVAGGTNDVTFTWDGSVKTSVAVSAQVSNATIASTCPFNGFTWSAHDVAVYGPGTYTVFASCAAKAPGCATGTNPITFTVGPDELGVHMLFNWGTVSTNRNIDVVNVWKKSVPVGPSPLWTGACGSNPANKVWDMMSKDPGTGINGYPMVDGGFVGFRANFNMMGPVTNRMVDTVNNNFTMIQPDAVNFGGTNDVHFTWDGTMKVSVAAAGQVSNATISSACTFFGQPWWSHDMAIYGPGTYTVYAACPAGSPGCGDNTFGAYTFTVGPGEIGGHLLFYWNGNDNIDVVNVWRPFSPADIWTGACGSNPPDKIWDWMSYDWDGDGVNGASMIDGPFFGMNANFNLMGVPPVNPCNDNNVCTSDTFDPLPGTCVFTPISCDDGNACTADSCDPITGCVHTPSVVCNDSNACTIDTCNPATGSCVYTPRVCNDNNACTTNACDPATGCVFTPVVCNDNNACTTDTCNTATGSCVFTLISCDDNNSCTNDTCVPATGQCVHTPINNCYANNNFTLVQPDNVTFGGTNDVTFIWDGTRKTSVVASGQVSNATISSSCPFLGLLWWAHDVAIYGPGTYSVYPDCPAGSPGCGAGLPITFTVGANEIGGHLLMLWNNIDNIDVVNVWTPNAPFAPSPLWTEGCGSNPAATIWGWMSKDFDGDGINGMPMMDGPFFGMNANFNLIGGTVGPCAGKVCDDGNICTIDTCDLATGNCLYTPVLCTDNNACTTDTCDVAAGCVYTPTVFCDDNNPCTTDRCDTSTGSCIFTPISCDDNNACTADSCDPAIGCVHTRTTCYVPIYTANNNFTMLDSTGAVAGGTNDVTFIWDGTLKTSVAVSGQVSNATIASTCPFNGFLWSAHDVAVYGPGTYTVYASCAAKAPGCATGTNPITFTVGPDELGVHMLFNWGTVSTNRNIDVVNVWKKSVMFGPSPLFTGACGSNPANKVWDLMSKDPGTGINGYPLVDGGFVGFRANFNMMGAPINRVVDTFNNNFTMNQPDGMAFGGTNDVRFTWDGTKKTAVAVSGQISNATISSSCPFFGNNWWSHDMAIYGPGTYTVYAACPAGSPGCGDDSNGHYTFTVKPGEIGGHMLFYWSSNDNIDVVNVWKKGSYDQGVDPMCPQAEFWTMGFGTNDPARIWDFMSYDWDNDCVNGASMVDGPFQGMNANFNLMGPPPCSCIPAVCNDNNACTIDTCDQANGCICVHTPINCNDNNACTTDSCNPVTGCVHYAVNVNDNNACTIDSCNPATGAVFTPINCDDNNACTSDTCNSITGCNHTPIVCNDNNQCTSDSCDAAAGCVYTPLPDQTACTLNYQAGICMTGICIPVKVCNGVKSVTIRGGGQKPTTVDRQIQTNFTVVNDGCIVASTTSSVTCSPGTVMLVNVKAGKGPMPTSCTWKGVPISTDSQLSVTCPATSGDVGKLICDNKLSGGKDSDRMSITVQ